MNNYRQNIKNEKLIKPLRNKSNGRKRISKPYQEKMSDVSTIKSKKVDFDNPDYEWVVYAWEIGKATTTVTKYFDDKNEAIEYAKRLSKDRFKDGCVEVKEEKVWGRSDNYEYSIGGGNRPDFKYLSPKYADWYEKKFRVKLDGITESRKLNLSKRVNESKTVKEVAIETFGDKLDSFWVDNPPLIGFYELDKTGKPKQIYPEYADEIIETHGNCEVADYQFVKDKNVLVIELADNKVSESRKRNNGRKLNLKETYYVGYGDTKGQKYYGLDEVDYIYRNNYEDPLLAYNGYIINSAYVDEALYDMFIEDTADEYTGAVDDYYYDQWVKENKHLIISTLDEIIAGYGFPNTFNVKYLIDHNQKAMLEELADEMMYDIEGNRTTFKIFSSIDSQELLDYYGNKKFTLADFYSLPYID